MKWKLFITTSLLSLALAACVEKETIPNVEDTIIYEQNENYKTVQDEQSTDLVSLATDRFEVKFEYIIDDTMVISKANGETEKVRFLLIDTPDMNNKETGEIQPQPFAEQAKARTNELLSSAKVITLETDEGDKYDAYDRLLAYAFVDGQSVQEILLKEGLVKVAYFPSNTRYLKDFEAAQASAQAEGIGLWK